jgi:hypothetical protein
MQSTIVGEIEGAFYIYLGSHVKWTTSAECHFVYSS